VTRIAPLTVVALLVAGITVGIASPAAAAPVTDTIDDIVYTADDANIGAGATITDYVGSATTVVIPDEVVIDGDTYAVTTIGDSAFFSNGLTSVTIPDSVTTIELGAFADNSLTSVTIPDSVTTIGTNAFRLNALTSVTIPASVTTIGNGAFGQNELTSVDIADGVTTIGVSAFAVNQLTSVVIPASVTTIGAFAFQANDLASVDIPASVTSIGTNTFADNPLTSVVMAGPAPTVGNDVFGDPAVSDAVVTYSWPFDAALVTGGYTSPTWEGYDSQAPTTVAFDTAGGSTAPAGQNLVLGATITEPAEPTRDGFTFDGWFTTPTGGTAWSFTDALNAGTLDAADTGGTPADLVLYAQWSEPELANTGADVTTTGSIAAGLLLAGALALLISRRRAAITGS